MESQYIPETFNLMNTHAFKNYLEEQLKIYNVNGISGSLIFAQEQQAHSDESFQLYPKEVATIFPFVAGKANIKKDIDMDPATWLQYASISKTIGAAYAIELFLGLNISLDSTVNNVLNQYGSSFKLKPVNSTCDWGNDVTIRMLLSHTAGLRMHYVKGIPLSDEFPSTLDLLKGNCEENYGYPPVYVHEKPGLHFSYSGASFLVLQHLLESIEKRNISDILSEFIQDNEGKKFGFCYSLYHK